MNFKKTLKQLIYTKINYTRLLICTLFALLFVCFIYSIPMKYSNIDDFYTGATIYLNFNKTIDKILPYLYLAITAIFYLINYEYIQELFNKIICRFEPLMEKIYTKRLSAKWVFLAISVILLLNYRHFDLSVPTDNYHFGEKLIGNILDINHLKIYKDYFPAHGYSDIIPSWLGSHLFNDNSVWGVMIGNYIFKYLQIFILSILAFIALPFGIAFMGCAIIGANSYIADLTIFSIYLLIIYIFITNDFLKKHFYLYSIILSLSAFCLYVFNPTFGAPMVLSMIVPYCFRFYNFYRNCSKKQVFLYIFIFLFINGLILFINREFFINNFSFILVNYKVNLLSFGNIGNFNPFNVTINSMQYLLLPFFVLLLADELSKNKKNIDKILLLTILISLPFFISAYSLGRLDFLAFRRAKIISYPVLIFALPLLFDNEKFKNIKKWFLALMVIFCAFAMVFDIIMISSPLKNDKQLAQNTNFKNGKAIFNEEHLKLLNSISDTIEKNAPENYTFLDLTNQGALYFYLNKTPLIPYIAYYNIPTPKQDKFYADILKNNLPDIVLIKGGNIPNDNLPASLRVYNIYKTLLLSNKYTVINNDNITILKKVDFHKFNTDEIKLLQDALGFYNLKNMPDVYGSSMKKLSLLLDEINIGYGISRKNGNFIIKFDKPVLGSQLDYMYFSTDYKKVPFYILINDFKIHFVSTKEKRLVPININPDILLRTVDKIEIYPGENINKIKNLTFYRKKENI